MDLLYSTENSSQYFVVTYMGKIPEKTDTYVYLNHFVLDLKLMQHCKSTPVFFFFKVSMGSKGLIGMLQWRNLADPTQSR